MIRDFFYYAFSLNKVEKLRIFLADNLRNDMDFNRG